MKEYGYDNKRMFGARTFGVVMLEQNTKQKEYKADYFIKIELN